MSAYPTPRSDDCTFPTTPETTQALLERLSSAVVTAINARDFHFDSASARELVAHISADFRAELDSLPNQTRPRTFEEQKLAWAKRVELYPDVHFHIVAIDSQVDEKKGRASVFMSMEVSGLGEGVVLHAMNQLEWRRGASEVWMCHRAVGMRGSPVHSG